MGDSENAHQPSKKRAAVKELSRDNPGLDDEEDSAELESGTFKKASDEVLASRRIVRVKRKEPSSTTLSSNPFAGIRLAPPTEPVGAATESNASLDKLKAIPAEVSTEAVAAAEKPVSEDAKSDANNEADGGKDEETVSTDVKKNAEPETDEVENAVEEGTDKATDENNWQSEKTVDDIVSDAAGDKKESKGGKTEDEEKKDNGNENSGKNADGAPLSSFQQHSSGKNAFTGLAGTGFSTSSVSFGSISQENSDKPTFSFGLSNNGNSSLFGSSGASIVPKNEGSAMSQMQEVPVETGEENERVTFSADSVLFEFLNGGWKERGKGELKVNVSTTGNGKARLLMRARGNYRLILNASLYPEMKLTNMDKKGVTFACVNSIGEGKDGLSTFALKFKDPLIVEEFRAAVLEHKDGVDTGAAAAAPPPPLKTPENSPKASAD